MKAIHNNLLDLYLLIKVVKDQGNSNNESNSQQYMCRIP